MMELKRCYSEESIRNILYRKDFCDIIFTGEGEYKEDNFFMDPNVAYMVLYRDEIPLGFASIRQVTTKLADIHGGVFPEYWGTGISDTLEDKLCESIKTQTEFNHLTTSCPLVCKSVLGLFLRKGWKLVTIYTKGVVYKEKVEDLCILTKTIKE